MRSMWCPLNAAQLLFALLSLLAGRCQAQPVGEIVDYPDQVDSTCTVGQKCSAGIGPADPDRGLCVQLEGVQECWDACNANHTVQSFEEATNKKAGMALLVQEVRTTYHLCAGTASIAECNLGQRCTPPGLTLNRGMCSNVNGVNTCLDMCDTKIGLETFKSQPAEQEGTANTVELVRDGHDPAGYTTCPGPSVWVWLWFPLLLCILIACCGVGYKAYDYWRKTLRGAKRGVRPDYGSYPEEPMMEDDYQQVMNQELDMPPAMPMEKELEMPMPAPEPIVAYAEPMPVMEPEPIIEYEAPAYTTNLFGTPSLQAQQMAAPATFYTSQPAQGYPATYSYAAPAAATSYSMPAYSAAMPQTTSYAMAQPAMGSAYYQQPTTSMRIG